jgi:hypothetical protein
MLIIAGLTFLVIIVDSHNIISLTRTETSELLVLCSFTRSLEQGPPRAG